MKLKALFFLLLLVSCQQVGQKHFSETDITLIPKPNSIEISKGSFLFTPETKLVTPDSLSGAIQILAEKFSQSAGMNLAVTDVQPAANFVRFVPDSSLEDEAYKITSHGLGVEIYASSYNGFVYAIQTICQLLPSEIQSEQLLTTSPRWEIPQLTITDKPAYKWRGLMLDVSRHFFDKNYILKTLDRMAMLKLNKFHFHLIDNEGWRLEIKKYPKLTQVGAWRVNQEDKHWNDRKTNSPTDPATYGGFYTQAEICEIVAHAQKLGIEVIPEIEMPAHTMSAIASYPHLSCHQQPIAVPSGGVWPITDIYCAGRETTFEFLQDVLDEVLELFPSKYIHIGGDEATHTEWEKCVACQQRMKTEKLENVHQLQSYFIKRIDKYLTSRGRILVGWDEIIEGGLPEQAVVMNWRGLDVVKKSIEKGHSIVLTSDCYIDKYQGLPQYEPLAIGGYLPLKAMYEYSLNEADLTPQEQTQILGSQANLWAEYVPNEKHSEYMIFPRLLALSEVVWSPNKNKNWNDFSARVQRFLPRLQQMNINYAQSMYQLTPEISEQNGAVRVKLLSEIPDAELLYSLYPFKEVKRYANELVINETTQLKAWLKENPQKVLSQQITFHKAKGKQVNCEPASHEKYSGQAEKTLTNIVRGTQNFHDKQWLGWLGQNVTITLDLEQETEIQKVVLGAMENQSSGIYFPSEIKLLSSSDGKNYEEVEVITRSYQKNPYAELKDFAFETQLKTRFLKFEITNLRTPQGSVEWLFIDEIQVF